MIQLHQNMSILDKKTAHLAFHWKLPLLVTNGQVHYGNQRFEYGFIGANGTLWLSRRLFGTHKILQYTSLFKSSLFVSQ